MQQRRDTLPSPGAQRTDSRRLYERKQSCQIRIVELRRSLTAAEACMAEILAEEEQQVFDDRADTIPAPPPSELLEVMA